RVARIQLPGKPYFVQRLGIISESAQQHTVVQVIVGIFRVELDGFLIVGFRILQGEFHYVDDTQHKLRLTKTRVEFKALAEVARSPVVVRTVIVVKSKREKAHADGIDWNWGAGIKLMGLEKRLNR